MNNIEKTLDKLPNIDNKLNKLSYELPSVNEERLADLCKNVPKEDLELWCKNLNDIFSQELFEKWLNFKWALSKLKKPLGVA